MDNIAVYRDSALPKNVEFKLERNKDTIQAPACHRKVAYIIATIVRVQLAISSISSMKLVHV